MVSEEHTPAARSDDPGTYPNTLASVSAGAGAPPSLPPPPSQPDAQKPKRFDFRTHTLVQKMRAAGIWTFLGDRWGDLEVRLRPFHEEAVVVKREAAEQAIRLTLGLADDDPLPPEKGIEVNKAAVNMAITGARGRILADEDMLRVARQHGFKIESSPEGDEVVLVGTEDAQQVRDLFALIVEVSMSMLTTLVRASRALHKVRDEEVARAGEAFVYGRHVKADWAD
jgi:hypothetical protein